MRVLKVEYFYLFTILTIVANLLYFKAVFYERSGYIALSYINSIIFFSGLALSFYLRNNKQGGKSLIVYGLLFLLIYVNCYTFNTITSNMMMKQITGVIKVYLLSSIGMSIYFLLLLSPFFKNVKTYYNRLSILYVMMTFLSVFFGLRFGLQYNQASDLSLIYSVLESNEPIRRYLMIGVLIIIGNVYDAKYGNLSLFMVYFSLAYIVCHCIYLGDYFDSLENGANVFWVMGFCLLIESWLSQIFNYVIKKKVREGSNDILEQQDVSQHLGKKISMK